MAVARNLREERHFRGYIQLKTIPEADDALIAAGAGLIATPRDLTRIG